MIPVGLEPTTYGLTCHFGFRRRPSRARGVRGLDSLFACTRGTAAVVRHPPSSLYTFPAPARGGPRAARGLARDWDLTPFPEFDGIHAKDFAFGAPSRSPLLYQLSYGIVRGEM